MINNVNKEDRPTNSELTNSAMARLERTTVVELTSENDGPTMNDSDDQSENVIPIKVPAPFVQRHTKKLVSAVVVFGLIIALVWDFTAKSCVFTENQIEIRNRLVCELIDLTPEEQEIARNTSTITGTVTFCTSLPSEDEEVDLQFDPIGETCYDSSGCTTIFMSEFIDWIADNPGGGAMVFAIVYAIAVVLFIPALILTIGAGAAFTGALGPGLGLLVGSLSVLVGAYLGAIVAFFLARYALRSTVDAWARKYKWVGAFDSALKDKGLSITLLLRFSPLIPFSVFNYIMGVTGLSTREYVIGTVIGIIPGTIAFVFVGGAVAMVAHDGMAMMNANCDADKEDVVTTVVLVVGSVATVVAAGLITHYARKKLKEAVEKEGQAVEKEGEADLL